MAWEVEVTDEFAAWYGSLDDEAADRTGVAIDKLAEVGPTLGEESSNPVDRR